MKVLMIPNGKQDKFPESGIRRVVEAYVRYLTPMGVEFVDYADDCDLAAIHAGSCEPLGIPTVSHIHGLYWTADYSAAKWEWRVNKDVVDVIHYASAVTVPSQWVAETFQRDMRFTPVVVPHGIEWSDWQHDRDNGGYVLWNKNRTGDVCDILPLTELAQKNTGINFVSTFMPKLPSANIRVTGVVPHQHMKGLVQSAAVYLATTKETFGIGVLEAMASGVPVLGYAHGGILGLVQHGVNGYLARPGDLGDLNQGLEYCLRHRDILGYNGREIAKTFSWGTAAELVYGVYESVVKKQPPTVSVIIPSYNYGDKVERAINSALAQTSYLHEVIVVDDGSTDDGLTGRVVNGIDDKRIRYIRKENGGVATARNCGIASSSGKYICCLDADDAIAPTFLQTLVPALENDSSLGIAYSGLQFILPGGRTGLSNWPTEWDFDKQLKSQNQIPTCCVFKREMWQRLGGYRQRYAPNGQGAEDAEFWLRSGAYGYRAKKVTPEGLFLYSWMSGRASGDKNYKEPNWTFWHPWAIDNLHPFASYAKPSNFAHAVRQYDEPTVSVIIPVGPGHERLLVDALDSLEGQTYRKWEAIVVWDTNGPIAGDYINYMTTYPFVKWVEGRKVGPGAARNDGVKVARGGLLLFLDADDILLPTFLEKCVNMFESTGDAIYTDYEGWAEVDDVSKLAKDLRDNVRDTQLGITRIGYRAAEYDCERAQRQPEDNSPYLWCDICTIHPKVWYNEIGGFDETLSSWEDVDYWWRLARNGHCFRRIPEEGFIYRFYTGTRRQQGLDKWPALLKTLKEKYSKEPAMGCSRCGKKSNPYSGTPVRQVGQQVMASPSSFSDGDLVLCEYNHPNIGQHPVYGNTTRHFYGYRGRGEQFLVHKADINARPGIFLPIVTKAAPEPPPVVPEPPRPITQEPDGTVLVPIHAKGGVNDGAIRELQDKIAASVVEAKPAPLPDGYVSIRQEQMRKQGAKKATKKGE